MTAATWHWLDKTSPFSKLDEPEAPARFVVEQISDTTFRVDVGFQYNSPDDRDPIVVTRATMPKTDFASIPRFMSWLVSRYGHHTPAALVHDREVVPGMSFPERTQADLHFLQMMDETGVPPVQSRLMWAAVTLATRLHGDTRAKLGMGVWIVAAAGGMVLFVAGAASTTPWMLGLAVAGPALASPLWGHQWRAGLIGGYALPVIAFPALAAFLGYLPYVALEAAVRFVRKRLPHNADKHLTKPLGFQGR